AAPAVDRGPRDPPLRRAHRGPRLHVARAVSAALPGPGFLLAGGFHLEEAVRRGGMGTVYRGRDVVAGCSVAVKLVAAERPGDAPARFAREAPVLAAPEALPPPGIVRYITHGRSPQGVPFLVMEWLEGEDLRDRLARAPLTVGDSLLIARRVAGALAEAHGHG